MGDFAVHDARLSWRDATKLNKTLWGQMPLSAWVDAFGWPHVPTGHGEGTGTWQDYLANSADEKNEGHCTEIEKYERKKSGE